LLKNSYQPERQVAACDNLTTPPVATELKRAHKFSEDFIETENISGEIARALLPALSRARWRT
jgi:hypothetical protein